MNFFKKNKYIFIFFLIVLTITIIFGIYLIYFNFFFVEIEKPSTQQPSLLHTVTINSDPEALKLIAKYNLQTIHDATVTGLHIFSNNNYIYLVGITSPMYIYADNFAWEGFLSVYSNLKVNLKPFAYNCYVINVTKDPKTVGIILWTCPDMIPSLHTPSEMLNWFLEQKAGPHIQLSSCNLPTSDFAKLYENTCIKKGLLTDESKYEYFKKW